MNSEQLNRKRSRKAGTWFGAAIDLRKAFTDPAGAEAQTLIEVYDGFRKRLSRKHRKAIDLIGDDVTLLLQTRDREFVPVDQFISMLMEDSQIAATALERRAIHFVNFPLPYQVRRPA